MTSETVNGCAIDDEGGRGRIHQTMPISKLAPDRRWTVFTNIEVSRPTPDRRNSPNLKQTKHDICSNLDHLSPQKDCQEGNYTSTTLTRYILDVIMFTPAPASIQHFRQYARNGSARRANEHFWRQKGHILATMQSGQWNDLVCVWVNSVWELTRIDKCDNFTLSSFE